MAWEGTQGIGEGTQVIALPVSAMCQSGTWHGWGHSTAQSGDSGHGNLLWAVLGGAGVPRSHHVGLQQGSLQVDVVIAQCLVHSCQHLGRTGSVESPGMARHSMVPALLPPHHSPSLSHTGTS